MANTEPLIRALAEALREARSRTICDSLTEKQVVEAVRPVIVREITDALRSFDSLSGGGLTTASDLAKFIDDNFGGATTNAV